MTEKEQREHVEGLWRLGYTPSEIAQELGWTQTNPRMVVKQLRAKGYDLPIRIKRAAACYATGMRWVK